MNSRSLVLPLLAISLGCASGCAQKPAAAPVQPPMTQPTSAAMPSTKAGPAGGNVYVSEEILRACKIEFNDVDKAPKFDFDQSALLPQDRSVLQQVAVCLTTGPLKGRAIKLVGRADPRAKANTTWRSASTVRAVRDSTLANLGVSIGKIAETSRGSSTRQGPTRPAGSAIVESNILLQ